MVISEVSSVKDSPDHSLERGGRWGRHQGYILIRRFEGLYLKKKVDIVERNHLYRISKLTYKLPVPSRKDTLKMRSSEPRNRKYDGRISELINITKVDLYAIQWEFGGNTDKSDLPKRSAWHVTGLTITLVILGRVST